jgi:hypothetical protein
VRWSHDRGWIIIIIAIRLLDDGNGSGRREAVKVRPGHDVLIQHVDLRSMGGVKLRETAHLHVYALQPLRDDMVLSVERVVRLIRSSHGRLQRIHVLPYPCEPPTEAPDLWSVQRLRRVQRVHPSALRGVRISLCRVTL